MRGILSIIIGLVMIVGGLSGQLALKGTGSSYALAGVGLVLLVIGLFTMVARSDDSR
jgi:hypothetical protein